GGFVVFLWLGFGLLWLGWGFVGLWGFGLGCLVGGVGCGVCWGCGVVGAVWWCGFWWCWCVFWWGVGCLGGLCVWWLFWVVGLVFFWGCAFGLGAACAPGCVEPTSRCQSPPS
ncbi:hypothetical protein, partial [Acinetobacter baumannii]|uniref:hypothetical protein n=1 Tax=Acinetobacter baumannii TaxID=470 RepID=UPI001BC86C78